MQVSSPKRVMTWFNTECQKVKWLWLRTSDLHKTFIQIWFLFDSF